MSLGPGTAKDIFQNRQKAVRPSVAASIQVKIETLSG
jgi:hypothetical protein